MCRCFLSILSENIDIRANCLQPNNEAQEKEKKKQSGRNGTFPMTQTKVGAKQKKGKKK